VFAQLKILQASEQEFQGRVDLSNGLLHKVGFSTVGHTGVNSLIFAIERFCSYMGSSELVALFFRPKRLSLDGMSRKDR
jgi:hypothetical protein